MKQNMISKIILTVFLVAMAGMILAAIFFKGAFLSFMDRPVFIRHARFMHIAAATVFFSNAMIGMIWERHSLASWNKEVILHTYQTVTSLDALLSSPLILLSLIGGLSLSFRLGEWMRIGWLSVSFFLFILSGVVWVLSDIPTQYKVKRLLSGIRPEDPSLPSELIRVMKLRWWIGLAGVLPLAVAFVMMVYKPEIRA